MANTDRTVLQIPMDMALRKSAEKVALEQGFSSVQEAVRLFLHQLKDNVILFQYSAPKTVVLSAKAAKRYDKIIADMNNGNQSGPFETVEELMAQLNA
jgi:hypothetical protein